MANFTAYKLLDACREHGCPVCRLEQQGVERYLASQFYENVNSTEWRNRLRASLGFCDVHAWLAVDRRLGDALGFSLIYRDVINTILDEPAKRAPSRSSRRWTIELKRLPQQPRDMVERLLHALTPQKRCPACQHRDEVTRITISVLVNELETVEMINALRASDGLCLPHLRVALGYVRDLSVSERLLTIHREKLESLRAELAEFIRKNDYQYIEAGFGREGDAWLRAIGMLAGSRRDR